MHTTEFFRSLLALVAGGVIGAAFGFLQNRALLRNEKAQRGSADSNAPASMMGSMRRVAYLLVLLVLIQILCPLLFVDGSQWWVSAGVVLGYGSSLFARLRHRNQSLR